jgi:thioredoxin-related protein
MKKASFLAVLGLFAATAAFAQNRAIKFETGSFADVLAKAKKENKPIMMDAYTTWCGPCKMMDKQVFTNDTVADYFNANFIPYKSDMEKGEGKELAKRFEVRAYPNFVFIAPDGSVLHRSVGARPPHAFVEVGKDALNPEKRYAAYQKKYDAGKRSPEFLTEFATIKERAALDNRPEIEAYFATQKPAELSSRKNWKMMNRFLSTSTIPAFKNLVDQRVALAKLYTQDSVDQLIVRVYEDDLQMALRKNNSAEIDQLKSELTKLKMKDADRIILWADVETYKKKGDYDNYAKTAAKLVDSYYANNLNALNSYAWTFYEKVDDKKMLAKAESWINKAVKEKPVYAFQDTQAAVLYKLGKKKEAKAAAENAIASGKKTGEDVTETEALLQKINALK